MHIHTRKWIKELLKTLGFDLENPHFTETPDRVAEMLISEIDVPGPPKLKTFPSENDQMVVLCNHEVWGRCPHHLERIHYRVWVGYIPNGQVVGVSKLARAATYFFSRWKIQEDNTEELANYIYKHEQLRPLGVGVCAIGKHMCMSARGAKSTGVVVTTALRGVFLANPSTKEEFLRWVKKP